MTKPEKTAPATLPASLVAALPIAKGLIESVHAIEKLLPALKKDMSVAEKKGAIALARAFVVLHRTSERLDGMKKAFATIFEDYKNVRMPEALEQEGVTNVPLAEGFRVQINSPFRASVKKDQKEEAWEWLRKNGFADLITETVNASTLSAAAQSYIEDQGKELPDSLFNAQPVPYASVVKTK